MAKHFMTKRFWIAYLAMVAAFALTACSSDKVEVPAVPAPVESVAVEAPAPAESVVVAPEARDDIACSVQKGTIMTPGKEGFRSVSCHINRPYFGYVRYGDKLEIVKVFADGGYKPNGSAFRANNFGDFRFDGPFSGPAEVTVEVGEGKRVVNGHAVSKDGVAPVFETRPALPPLTFKVR